MIELCLVVIIIYIKPLVTYFVFAGTPRAPPGVCLVCGFSLITSPSPAPEALSCAFAFRVEIILILYRNAARLMQPSPVTHTVRKSHLTNEFSCLLRLLHI